MYAIRSYYEEGPGVELTPLSPEVSADAIRYRHLEVAFDRKRRSATLTLQGPQDDAPADAAAMRKAGADLYHLRLFRELADALSRLWFNEPETGLLLLRTSGDPERVLAP